MFAWGLVRPFAPRASATVDGAAALGAATAVDRGAALGLGVVDQLTPRHVSPVDTSTTIREQSGEEGDGSCLGCEHDLI